MTPHERRRALLDRAALGSSLEERLLRVLALSTRADLLDVGAGKGALLKRLRVNGHAGRLVGLDLVRPPETDVEWFVGAAEALPFAANTFDAVGFFQSLFHLDAPRALAEARRVLRPGGRLVATSNSSGHLANFWGLTREKGEVPAELLEDRLAGLLKAAGLVPKIQCLSAPVRFTPNDVLALLDSYRSAFDPDANEWRRVRKAVSAALAGQDFFEDRAELVLCST